MRVNSKYEPWVQWVGPGEVEFQFSDWAIEEVARSLRAARSAAAYIAGAEDEYERANAHSRRSYFTLSRYPCLMDGHHVSDGTWWAAIQNVNRWLARWGYRRFRTPE